MNELSKEMQISADYQGQRIDRVLAQLFPDYSRSKLCSWLKAGAITVNNQHYKPDEKVWGGEHVILQLAPSISPLHLEAENIPLDIIFEDEELLVLNKPAGLIVHPGAGNPRHTLVNALLHHDAKLYDLPRAGIIHRLDKDTTGLLVVAKTLETHTSLVRQMQAREIQRQYITLVHGHVIGGGTLNTAYGRDPRNRLKMAVCAQGREAITQYSVKKHYQFVTLLNVQLMTGRTHQIRVHMAHLNHAVVGDPLYQGRTGLRAGINPTIRQALQQFKRQALHASNLSFLHPKLETTVSCAAPLPDDLQSLINLLDAPHD
ncbi:MAG: 23S rRNA pseudouridine(1911/1915/1917) synthase RluD [Legionellaceae bacterium]|nr:23S rRNA pseudouridine(1911/1915/1917) synthase RluD [Legionellaceae bacterium]